MKLPTALSLSAIFLFSPLFADWSEWRGPNGNGSVKEGKIPSEFSPEGKGVVWKTALPGRGCSTPVVAGDHLFLTSPIDGKDGLCAYDLDGKEKWRLIYGEETKGRGQRVGSGSNSSPVSDGEHVFGYFKSGREIARGNNFTTKVIRPAAIKQAEKTDSGEVALDNFYDTYHSPLNPFIYGAVLKAVGGDDFDKYQLVTSSQSIYRLDRVIAAVSVICFLIAIGVNYLLISRVFDVRIAGVVALLMALSDLMWQFTHTGLPQMLMLLLFSCALFFAYRAMEATVEGKVALGPVLVAAVFFALLALAHWLSIWITIGFVIYAAFFFRPKGVAALAVLGILLLFSLYFVGKNLEWTGSPAGTAGLTLYGGLTDSEEGIMRAVDTSDKTYAIIYNMNSLLLNTFRNILVQADALYTN
ncbi:PQQ-binding-like beta-propeller repeat protein, partial [bacterium]|nr:PQQ-binding-like beta-propeller repeat protein [bacterium]